MARTWKCAHCSTPNPETTLTCSNCGRIQGSVVVPSTTPPPAASAPVPGWPTGGEPAAAAGPKPPLWRRIPLAGLIVVGFLVAGSIGGLLFNATRSDTGEISKAGDLEATELQVGDCFDLKDPTADEVTDVTARPCAEEHEYELFFAASMPEGSYPSEEAFGAFVEERCVPAFEEYVGTAYLDSKLDIYWMYPLEDVWNAGDREVQCSAYHPRVNRLTGTLKGSNQ